MRLLPVAAAFLLLAACASDSGDTAAIRHDTPWRASTNYLFVGFDQAGRAVRQTALYYTVGNRDAPAFAVTGLCLDSSVVVVRAYVKGVARTGDTPVAEADCAALKRR